MRLSASWREIVRKDPKSCVTRPFGKSCALRGIWSFQVLWHGQTLFDGPPTDIYSAYKNSSTTSIRCNLYCSLVHSAPWPDPPELPASYLALVGFHLRITPPSSMKITMATRGTSNKNPNAWRKNKYSAGVNTFTVNFSEFGRGSLARGVVSQARLLTPAEEESGHHAQLVNKFYHTCQPISLQDKIPHFAGLF